MHSAPVQRWLNQKLIKTVWGLAALALLSGCAARKTVPPGAGAVKAVKFDEADYRLIWPLPVVTTARISSSFGARRDPLNGMRNFHTGVDLEGEPGTPIYAAGSGKVIFSGNSSGFGLLLIVDHGNSLSTYYGHCSRLLLERDKRVDRGQVIALIGATGRATGAHLHFEVRKYGRPLDPFSLLPALRRI